MRRGLATAALVTGLVGVALGAILLFPLSLPLGILATIFGGIGLRRSARVGRGRPQAITGLITGPLAVLAAPVTPDCPDPADTITRMPAQ